MKSQGKVSIILLTQTAIIQALTKTGEKNFKKLCIFLKKFPLPHPLSEFILELFSVRTAGGAFFQYTIHIINFTTYVRVKKNRRHIQNQPISTYLESKNPPLLCTILYIYIYIMPRRKKQPEIVNEADIEKIRASLTKTNIKLKKVSLTEKQLKLLKIIFDNDSKIIFISGPAGTSKTYVAIYGALQLYNMNNERGITYVRTIAESGEKSLGALPGEMAEKINPYMMPMNEKLDELLIPGQASIVKEKEIIKGMPINYLRGASWRNEIVIADESQNFTFKELTTLMTRLGEGSKLLICGDPMQSDINGKSGFADMYSLFNDNESKEKGIHTFYFGPEDIKRSEILKYVIKKLQNHSK